MSELNRDKLMANINRWLLPEGVEEILPRQAWQIEQFKRSVLDTYRSWGYELVIPPLIEYSESLLIGMGSDIDLQSFKLTDQLSGRTLAIRADITPQTARIDAHSYKQSGPTRLCYAGTVLHTKPKSQLASRMPIEIGAELYGDTGIHGDTEVISLMLTTIQAAKVNTIHLDLGHVVIYRTLVESAGLSDNTQQLLLDAFDRKAKTEINTILTSKANGSKENNELIDMLNALADLHGGVDVLQQAKQVFQAAPPAVLNAIDYLQNIVENIQNSFPEITLYIDLAELRGYQYHTGLVFAAYIDGAGHAVANGGRYDGIGEAFGRARPATGFSANVKALLALADSENNPALIIAPSEVNSAEKENLATAIQALRKQGERVVQHIPGQELPENCTRELINENGIWQVKPRP